MDTEHLIKEKVGDGADVNCTDKYGNTPLHIAVKNDTISPLVLRCLIIELGANLNKLNGEGYTPLHICVIEGRDNCLAEVIKNEKLNVNKCSKGAEKFNGHTALHMAVELGRTEMVKCLLQWDADVNSVNDDGYTPLHISVQKGRAECFAELIKEETLDFNKAAEKFHLHTPLHIAVDSHSSEMVKLLIQLGADVNSLNDDGYTPLHISVLKGHTSCFKELIRVPTLEVNKRSKGAAEFNGHNALHMALTKKRKECVDLLMKHKELDVNLVVDAGCTKVMEDHYMDHTVPDSEQEGDGSRYSGYTALHIAAGRETKVGKGFGRYKTDSDCLQELLKHHNLDVNKSVSMNCNDRCGFTALQLAICQNDRNCVEHILKHSKLDINRSDDILKYPSFTAIHLATELGRSPILDILLKHPHIQIDKTTTDECHKTALHIAKEKQDGKKCFAKLMEYGADPIDCEHLTEYTKTAKNFKYMAQLLDNSVTIKTGCPEEEEVESSPVDMFKQYLRDDIEGGQGSLAVNNHRRISNEHSNTIPQRGRKEEDGRESFGVDNTPLLGGDLEMTMIQKLAESNESNILLHPVIGTFLNLKKAKLQVLWFTGFLLTAVYFGLTLVYQYNFTKCLYTLQDNLTCNLTHKSVYITETGPSCCYTDPWYSTTWMALVLFASLFGLYEILQMITLQEHYWMFHENYQIVTACAACPYPSTIFLEQKCLGIISMITCGMNAITYLGNVYGNPYVIVFQPVLKKTLAVLLPYMIIFTTFWLVFVAMFESTEATEFDSLGLTVLSYVVFVTNGLDNIGKGLGNGGHTDVT